MYCSYKRRSLSLCHLLSCALTVLNMGRWVPLKKFPWGRTWWKEESADRKEVCISWIGWQKVPRSVWKGGEGGVDWKREVSGALGETKSSVGLWGWVWQDWGSAGLTVVAVPNGIGIKKSQCPCKPSDCFIKWLLYQIGLCSEFQLEEAIFGP